MKPDNNTPPRRPASSNRNKSGHSPKNLVFYAVLIIFAVAIFGLIKREGQSAEISFSELVNQVNQGKVAKIVESGSNLSVYMKNSQGQAEQSPSKVSRIPSGASASEQGLKLSKTKYVVVPPDNTSDIIWNIASIVVPVLLMLLLFAWMMRQAGAQNNQSLSFGKSKAKLYGMDRTKTKFSEIAGNDNAKQDLAEVVDFLRHPRKFLGLGAKIPKGVLLVGPPGTGKTMMARAVAGEAGVPFFSISGSEFVEMFVGVGASRVRDLFDKAKKNAPCIIFIDEIDAVGRRRGSGMGGGHDEREQTLNQILVEMDGFEKDQNVIVLAATNRADVLDPALLRPGRFDRRVNITLPERQDRLAILKVHFREKPTNADVDLNALAAKTAGMSGADLANIANEAAIRAARLDKKEIDNSDVTEALEKVAIGPERRSNIMREKDKIMTAYHEGGHALVAQVLPDSDNVHKVTIIPRGATGGVTWTIPEHDRPYTSMSEYKDELARAMGGRIAEEVIYGRDHVTSGASSDLRHATAIARDIIKTNRALLEKLKDALLEHETLDADEVAAILDGMVLPETAKLY